MSNYSDFEDKLLVAAYLTTEDTGEDYLRLSEIISRYPVEYKSHWVMRALQAYVDSGYSDDVRHLGGDVLGQSVSLTSSGFKEAERLIELGVSPHVSISDYNSIPIPAADRVVALSHNQIGEVERPLTEVIAALESDNGNPDSPGLRERLIGQLKAGRELVQAGEFQAYLVYATLVRGLGELISKYGNPVLAALANAVLSVIVTQVFQAN